VQWRMSARIGDFVDVLVRFQVRSGGCSITFYLLNLFSLPVAGWHIFSVFPLPFLISFVRGFRG